MIVQNRPYRGWLVGYVLAMLTLPATILDAFLDRDFHAPHPQCDSIGALFAQVSRLVIPSAFVIFLTSGLLVLVACWRRQGGLRFMALPFDAPLRATLMTVVFAALASFFVYEAGRAFWSMLVAQTTTVDCNGRADPLTVTTRLTPLQVLPFLNLAIAYWLLRLRAVAVSPWKTPV